MRKFFEGSNSSFLLDYVFGFEFSNGLGSFPHCSQLVMSGNKENNYVYLIRDFSRSGKLFFDIKYTFG